MRINRNHCILYIFVSVSILFFVSFFSGRVGRSVGRLVSRLISQSIHRAKQINALVSVEFVMLTPLINTFNCFDNILSLILYLLLMLWRCCHFPRRAQWHTEYVDLTRENTFSRIFISARVASLCLSLWISFSKFPDDIQHQNIFIYQIAWWYTLTAHTTLCCTIWLFYSPESFSSSTDNF